MKHVSVLELQVRCTFQTASLLVSSLLLLVHSFIEFQQYIFKIPGVTVFFSNRLSQDPVEKFFGQQRQRGHLMKP